MSMNYNDVDAVLSIFKKKQETNSGMPEFKKEEFFGSKVPNVDDIEAIFAVFASDERKKRHEEEISGNNKMPLMFTPEEVTNMSNVCTEFASASIGGHGMVSTEAEVEIEDFIDVDKINRFMDKIRQYSVALCLATTIFSSVIISDLVSPVFNPINDAFDYVNNIVHTVHENKDRREGVKNGINALLSTYRQNMLYRGLAVQDPNKIDAFVILDNSVDGYKGLGANDLVDVYIYRQIFAASDRIEEFDKFIKSVEYFDTEGNLCNYVSFDQFMRINGYPDIKTFENYAETDIYELYKSGEINLAGLEARIPTRGGL